MASRDRGESGTRSLTRSKRRSSIWLLRSRTCRRVSSPSTSPTQRAALCQKPRYILAWKLCTTMSATDVSDTLQVALRGSGLNQVKVLHRPRLLSDNGPSYVSSELGKWLEDNGIRHIRGRPYHTMTQGKIERYHRSMKNRILLDNYYLPGQLEQSIEEFVSYYNNCRYHESLDNLTPADVYFGRGRAILERREKIKRETIEQRRRLHQQAIAA